MARIYGLNGALRGRQGNNVYSIQNGTQVVKAYQPVVSNPRTPAQTSQRTKFALAGKMSSATPLLALSGLMGGNAREKRARFVQLITRRSVVLQNGLSFRASIPLADVIYSEGALPTFSTPSAVSATWLGSTNQARNNIRVDVTPGAVSSLAPSGYAELYVFALYDTETNNLETCVVAERSSSSAVEFSQTIRVGYYHSCYVAVYQLPFARLSDRSRPVSSDVGADESNAYLIANQNYLMSGSEWGRSILVGSVPLLVSESASPSVVPPEDESR